MYHQRPIKNKFLLNSQYWLLFILAPAFAGAPDLPLDIHALALATINSIYNEKYEDGKENARKIIKHYPDNPAGYFFMAATIDSWMATHFSDKEENEFYRFCELAIDKGDKVLENNPDDQWAIFFTGGAEGYKGNYEARNERWITAFRYGWKGVTLLMQLQDKKSPIIDLNYGIGCYEYWRSALMKNLWWMPGVEDKRQEGIEKLLKARTDGTYVKTAASVSLIDVYLNEKKYDDALRVAEEGISQFPGSLIFSFGKIKVLYQLKRYIESETTSLKLLTILNIHENTNLGAKLFCHYWLAKCCFSLGHFDECEAECDKMKTYELTDDCKKIMQKYLNEGEFIKKQALSGRKNN